MSRMRYLLFIVSLIVVSGCSFSSRKSASGLDAVESLLQSDPIAAMECLNGYDVSEFEDSATLARWALLYSESLAANNISAPTDTIVDIAIDYYSSHNLEEESRHASRLKSIIRGNENKNSLASALYIQKEKEFLLYKERMRRERSVYAALIMMLVACGVILWQRHRLNVRKEHEERLVSEAHSLREGMLTHRRTCSELESKLMSMLSTRFNVIDGLCETYYESQGTQIERKAIANKVKSQIDDLKTDSGIFSEMERCVNDCRSGMLELLKKEWPDIKPEDYRLIVYIACNLSARSVALLIGESVDVVYKRKSRLKSKLAALALPLTELFLSVF